MGAGQTNVSEFGLMLPTDARLGKWKVGQVAFRPTNDAPRDLAVSGNVVFEVIKRETVLPTSADVEVK